MKSLVLNRAAWMVAGVVLFVVAIGFYFVFTDPAFWEALRTGKQYGR